ncbi:MAG: cobamide remodeling phosphodiesterase CbiR [Anaerolineae bacterium]|nr:hypothetical protein [Thermoflexales bacterium]MDW8407949.1 cobamide remodeling phosphodiesterase CbiR [Anaerolineae bacterium]
MAKSRRSARQFIRVRTPLLLVGVGGMLWGLFWLARVALRFAANATDKAQRRGLVCPPFGNTPMHIGPTQFTTPFRLGSTSYVYAADLLTNVERLAGEGHVDDIELVLFELENGPSNLPDERTVRAMAEVASAHRVSFTAHLPLDLRYDTSDTHPSLRLAQRVIELTRPLQPLAYVFHLDGAGIEHADWMNQALQAVETALRWVPAPDYLALENLENYDPLYLEPIYAAFPIGRALDIGHVWKQGRLFNSVKEYGGFERLRVVHLHGCATGSDGKREDHLSLSCVAPAQLEATLRALAGFTGVLTLEVFGEDDFFASRTALLQTYNRLSTCPT